MAYNVLFLKGTQQAYDNLSVKNPNAFYVTEKNIYLGEIQLSDQFDSLFAAVAFTGSYIDLENKPNIPSKISELENDTGFVSVTIDTEMSGESTNPVQNKVITAKIIEEVMRAKEAEALAIEQAKAYTNERIASLIGEAPEALDTIVELAEAIRANKDVIDAINASITNKVDKVEGKGLSTNDYISEDRDAVNKIKSSGVQKLEYDDTNNSLVINII